MAEADDEFMDQSIRNEIPGTVKEIISDKVLSEIIGGDRHRRDGRRHHHTLGARHGT
jgi:hypothetical protein